MGEVKVIGIYKSLFCTRIEWALKLKGVEYEYLKENLKNKSEILLKSNPVLKKVPVLLDHGKPIVESLVILEYIDEKWKHNPLLPQDPYERAKARFWATFADEKCVYGAIDACWKEGEDKEKQIEIATESFAYLEEEIKGKKFFGGEKIGYLDLVMGWIPLWLSAMEEVGGMKLIDSERFPSLFEWTHNFIEIPLINQCLPPRSEIVKHFINTVKYKRSTAANNK